MFCVCLFVLFAYKEEQHEGLTNMTVPLQVCGFFHEMNAYDKRLGYKLQKKCI